MAYDYILLDWDGNLAKTLDVWLEVKRTLLVKRGIVLSDEQIATSFGAPHEKFTEWGVTDIDLAIQEMDALAKQKLPDVDLYPAALEVLDALDKAGKKLALITSSLHENVEHTLKRYNMLHYFDAIIANEDTERHKPHPEPLEKALELLGGSKNRAVMIGDSDKDLGAAQNAAIDSILFYPPEHKKFYRLAELQKLKPTYVVEDFRKVLDIV
ncbi:MAG TPA: HAD-IA family hydrolase [Candidatus Saccharimonadales bacterium]|nr:HAD-IA family hydrolase [Candidatus Saccharimonadales bacterium]